MKFQSNTNLRVAAELYVNTASFISMGVGVVVILLGWYLNIPFLKSIFSDAATMKFNTALCFLCSGLALWLLRQETNPPPMKRAGRIFAGLVLGIGLLSVIEYASGWNAGIDQLFIRDLATAPAAFPGRMSIITALCFSLCGLALLWIESRPSQYLSIAVLAFSLVAVIGYLFDYHALYHLPGFGSIALHTAWMFLILSLAILAARPALGIMREVMSDLEGGQAIRIFLPLTTLIMILLGRLIITGEHLGLYISADNMVILIVLLVLLYSPLIYLYARRINRAQTQVARLNRLYSTLSHINQSIVHVTTPAALYATICEVVIEYGEFRFAWIGLLDDHTGDVRPVAQKGIGSEWLQTQEINIRKAPFDQGLVGRAFHSRQISTSEDIQNDAGMTTALKEYNQQFGFRAAAVIPFRLAGTTIGVLGLFASDLGFFELDQERQLLREIGNDISFALDSMVAEQARTHLAAVVESSIDAIITKDLNGTITSWNRGAELIFGYSAAEIIGQPILRIIPPDRQAEEQHILDQIKQDRRVQHFDTVRRSKDGRDIDVSLSVSPLRDANNRVIGASKIARDITLHKRMEADLRTANERFEKAFRASPQALVISRASNGEIFEVNESFIDLLGYTPEETTGITSLALGMYANPEDRQRILEILQAEGSVRNLELQVLRKSGEQRTVELSTEAIQIADEACLLTILKDITERKQAEAQINLQTQLLAQARDAIIAADENYQIIFWNPAAEALYGWRAEEIVGRVGTELLQTEFPEASAAHMRQTIRETGFWIGEVTQGRKDGTRFTCEISSTVLHDEDGQIMGYISVNRDITEQKQIEERFRLAIESAPNAIIMVDQNEEIVLVNSRTELDFGYTRAELIGETMGMLMPERFRADHIQHFRKYFTRPSARPIINMQHDFYGLRSDHTEFPLEIGLTPIEMPRGTLVMATIVNITQRKQAEAQLNATLEELKRSNADLEQFAYAASHDLQEPLRTITGMVQLLQRKYEGSLDERGEQYIEFTVEAAGRMQTLIKDLLEYSRLNRNLPEAGVDLNDIVEQVLNDLAGLIENSQAVIKYEALPTLTAERLQMIRLFQNIIGNAIKFRSQRVPEIHIAAREVDDMWEISIRDNGIGIEPRYFERIFTIFQRLHTRTEYPGTGIGLSICRKIVERHGGRIWVESAPGQGSIFYFTLTAKEW